MKYFSKLIIVVFSLFPLCLKALSIQLELDVNVQALREITGKLNISEPKIEFSANIDRFFINPEASELKKTDGDTSDKTQHKKYNHYSAQIPLDWSAFAHQESRCRKLEEKNLAHKNSAANEEVAIPLYLMFKNSHGTDVRIFCAMIAYSSLVRRFDVFTPKQKAILSNGEVCFQLLNRMSINVTSGNGEPVIIDDLMSLEDKIIKLHIACDGIYNDAEEKNSSFMYS
ncbi:MAG: hypothetical protein OXC48_01945 [Endozoicomonadaceae bacterium]|nr:hypothetical protein [Endozoicomonadaceae bacterium]